MVSWPEPSAVPGRNIEIVGDVNSTCSPGNALAMTPKGRRCPVHNTGFSLSDTRSGSGRVVGVGPGAPPPFPPGAPVGGVACAGWVVVVTFGIVGAVMQ